MAGWKPKECKDTGAKGRRHPEQINAGGPCLLHLATTRSWGTLAGPSWWHGKKNNGWSSSVAQWVKDSVLSLQWLYLLLCSGFDPWPRNFYMPWERPKKPKPKTITDRKVDFFFFFFCLFRAVPTAYGSSQARGSNQSCTCRPTPQLQQHQIQALSVTYTTAHSNTRPLTH